MENLNNDKVPRIKTKWESFKRRKKYTTLGTIIATVLVILIELYLKKHPFSVSINNKPVGFALEVTLILLFAFLPIFISDWWERRKFKNRIKEYFHHSYEIVENQISDIFSKEADVNKYREIDRIIFPSIKYANEILNGNRVPWFKPNDVYLKDIYKNDVKLIIAITAEDPCLWIDPTICYYLINCCAVSLLKNKDNNGEKKLTIKDFEDDSKYKKEVIDVPLESLDKLTKRPWDWTKNLVDIDFFRFFLIEKKQEECFKDSVYPWLKATHDLFKMKSYFNQKDHIKDNLTRIEFDNFNKHIDELWDAISISKPEHKDNDSFKSVIKKRKDAHLPEFLFLFETPHDKNHSVIVYTYVGGEACSVKYIENVDEGYNNVQTLVSYIANSVKKIGQNEQYTSTEAYQIKSRIEWS